LTGDLSKWIPEFCKSWILSHSFQFE
jgi:hypothetical protein